jgi:hypothetical protein
MVKTSFFSQWKQLYRDAATFCSEQFDSVRDTLHGDRQMRMQNQEQRHTREAVQLD